MSATRPDLKFVDSGEERGFYRNFIKLPTKPLNTIRIVDKNDYYLVVGSDAVFVADTIYHTQSVLKDCQLDPLTKKNFNEPTVYVTISLQILSNLLKTCLLELGYKVEIYDKTWKMLHLASPGNIEQVNHLMNNFNVESSIVIASLKVTSSNSDNFNIGITFIDTTNFKIGVLELLDNEVFSNLESFLIQLGIKECLLPENMNGQSTWKRFLNVIDRCNCSITFTKNGDYNDKNIESDLIKLTDNKLIMSLPQNYSKESLSACNALLSYLHIMSEETNLGKFELINHSLTEFIKLDASSMRALNLFSNSSSMSLMNHFTGTTNGNKINSLFQLLNHCKTNAGTRLLNEWLKQPLTDKSKIVKRHDLVDFLMDKLELRQMLQNEYLPQIPDVRRMTKRLNKNKNSPGQSNTCLQDVLRLYEFSMKIPEYIELLESFIDLEDNGDNNVNALIKETWIEPLKQHMDPLMKLQEMVQTTIDLEAYENNNDYMIRVEFNEELAQIKNELDELREQIKIIHLESAETLGFDAERKLKLENHHLHGWCMRLTRNDAKKLRSYKEFIELSTVKAGIFFSTKKLKEISSETTRLEKDYERQQSSLVKEIVDITLTYTPVMEKISLTLANLDVLNAFAHVSSYAPIQYVRPKMYGFEEDARKTKLIASRHPVVEMQDELIFISNDVNLETNTNDFQIITGPNMGGKSTYIRQIGVITLLAQIGCFVPCEEAEIAIVDAILCRVGAGDSQLKGVSTFMVEMLETASILKNATKNSLIIVDELGRGTSTYDGFGLAWAIAEHIASKIKCFTLFATHFHELTSLSDKLPNVQNLNVVAHIEQGEKSQHDSEDITLLYKVEPGISDQSFGIHVAEVVQFPQKIVKMAKRKADELEDLKQNNDELKKIKLSEKEITDGNEELKQLLKTWVAKIRSEGLANVENLKEEDAQQKIQELLKEIAAKSEKENGNKYLEYVKTLLL